MNNCMSGTSIVDLRKQQEMDDIKKKHEIPKYNADRMTQYGANQNLQYEQGHNDAYDVMQNQQDPYYTMKNVVGYPNNPEIDNNMVHLANKISSNLPQGSEYKISDEEILAELTKENFESESKNDNYNFSLKESAIILVIFILLSLPLVRT